MSAIEQVYDRLWPNADAVEKRNIMRRLRIDEVSAVDRPAQKHAVMTIMKRNDGMDRQGNVNAVGQRTPAQHAESLDGPIEKPGETEMVFPAPKKKIKTKIIYKRAVEAIEAGETTTPKIEFYDKLAKRAEKLRADGESFECAFNRVIMTDEKAKVLYKAMSLAPGRDTPAPVAPVVKAAPSLGPAHDRIHKLASKLRKREPMLSADSAFTKIFAAPENSELRAAAMNEERSRW